MKIKAFKMNPENVDSTIYLNFDGWDDFIIDGNSDFLSMHTDYKLYDRIKSYCVESDELLDVFNDYGDGYTYGWKNRTAIIEDYLGFHPTTKQVHDIINALAEYDKTRVDDDLIVSLLRICEKRPWTRAKIAGYVPGEWQNVFYPTTEYNGSFINYIESAYFNTGDEYGIVCVDDEDNGTEPYKYDDIYYDYFASDITWNEDKLKKAIADNVYGKPEDVVIYDYAEIKATVWHVA